MPGADQRDPPAAAAPPSEGEAKPKWLSSSPLPAEHLHALGKLIDGLGGSPNADLIEDLLATGLKLVKDGTDRGDVKVLLTTLKELRHAFRVFTPYRQIRKVSVFGSARTLPSEPEYQAAQQFANRLAQLGFMVITGAGGGIMEAAQGGAGRERSFGVNIRLPNEQKANPTIENDPKLINFKYFFTRKVVFVKETHAIALFPGGFGTHDEGFESLTLVQTGKTNPIPIVFIDRPGGAYWRDWKRYVEKYLLRRRLIDAEDMSL
ncbi:MAG: LOG family protein, partial [Anaerolineales bacterium]